MQFPQRIQPKRPTTRIRRNDPNVVAMRAQLESLSAAALRRLEDELRGYAANGVEGAMMTGLVAQAAATDQRLAA